MCWLNISRGQGSFYPEFILTGAFFRFFLIPAVAQALPKSSSLPPLLSHLHPLDSTTTTATNFNRSWETTQTYRCHPFCKKLHTFYGRGRIPLEVLEVVRLNPTARLLMEFGSVLQHMTEKSDSLSDCVIPTVDSGLRGSYDAKLTLSQLTVTLILCQLNQSFPCRNGGSAVRVRACACEHVHATALFTS